LHSIIVTSGIQHSATSAKPIIAASIDDLGNIDEAQSCSTHDTGFAGDVQIALREHVPSVPPPTFEKNVINTLELRMPRCIFLGIRLVVTRPNDIPISNEDTTNGYFTLIECLPTHGKSLLHETHVLILLLVLSPP